MTEKSQSSTLADLLYVAANNIHKDKEEKVAKEHEEKIDRKKRRDDRIKATTMLVDFAAMHIARRFNH